MASWYSLNSDDSVHCKSKLTSVAASLISPWLLWWPPAESHYNIYDHSVVGYVSHAHSIVLLYSVGNKITTTTTTFRCYQQLLCKWKHVTSFKLRINQTRSRGFICSINSHIWLSCAGPRSPALEERMQAAMGATGECSAGSHTHCHINTHMCIDSY